jgi:hypothetical protein
LVERIKQMWQLTFSDFNFTHEKEARPLARTRILGKKVLIVLHSLLILLLSTSPFIG